MKKRILNFLKKNKYVSLCLSIYFLTQKGGYLYESGWLKSAKRRSSIDKQNTPIPWLTYSCISFLKERIESSFIIFEYGSGNSTIWFSNYVQNIISCEHDINWYNRLKNNVSNKVNYLYRNIDTGCYCNEIKQYKDKFNIVLIDGRNRVETLKNSLTSLTNDGVIILDNSKREKYKECFAFLNKHSFKHVDFNGLTAGAHHPECTTIFYREQNCLGI